MNAEIEILATGRLQATLKRGIDICGALLGLILFGPIFILIGLALFFETQGKIYFRQERLGYGGRIFSILKFRTMREKAEENLEKILSEQPYRRAAFDRYQKLDPDPRLTHFGKFLRQTSLDG
jgi:lipopolysaccharide/colanic/teichoic acid biosynthesis glycosyltransferase